MATATARNLSNSELRTLFLASALRRIQPVSGNQSMSLGGTVTFNLPHAGIGTSILLTFNIPITIATAAANLGPKGPPALIQNVNLRDYNGVDRVNCSGYGLYLLSIAKRQRWEPSSVFPYVVSSQANPFSVGSTSGNYEGAAPTTVSNGAVTTTNTNAFRWRVPTAVSSDYLQFSLEVPISFGPKDPRGGLLMTIPNSNATLTLQFANALTSTTAGNADTVYNSATGTVTLGAPTVSSIQAFYQYLDPIPVKGVNAPNGIPLPVGDLSLVHEVKGIQDSSGLAASASKTVTLPAGRDFYRVIGATVENSTLNTSHLSTIQYLFDGQTTLLNETVAAHATRVQMELGREIPEGVLPLYDFADRPYDSSSYGSLAYQLNTSSQFNPAGSTYHETITDSLYSTAMANA